MDKSTINPRNKKRGRGRPEVDSEQVGIRLRKETIRRMDKWAKDFAPGENLKRPEIIRRIIKEYLESVGIE